MPGIMSLRPQYAPPADEQAFDFAENPARPLAVQAVKDMALSGIRTKLENSQAASPSKGGPGPALSREGSAPMAPARPVPENVAATRRILSPPEWARRNFPQLAGKKFVSPQVFQAVDNGYKQYLAEEYHAQEQERYARTDLATERRHAEGVAVQREGHELQREGMNRRAEPTAKEQLLAKMVAEQEALGQTQTGIRGMVEEQERGPGAGRVPTADKTSLLNTGDLQEKLYGRRGLVKAITETADEGSNTVRPTAVAEKLRAKMALMDYVDSVSATANAGQKKLLRNLAAQNAPTPDEIKAAFEAGAFMPTDEEVLATFEAEKAATPRRPGIMGMMEGPIGLATIPARKARAEEMANRRAYEFTMRVKELGN